MSTSLALKSPASSVTAIVTEQLRPLARQIDSEGLYPRDILQALGNAGAYARHSATLGDGPRGIVDAVHVMAEVGSVCLSTAFCMWCQDALVWYIDRTENAHAREKFLGPAAHGQLLGGTGLSNPMKALAGIEPLALKGKRVPGGYRVTGRLPFVSNVEDGHYFGSIFALEDVPNRHVMALFEAGREGIKLAHNSRFIALEGTATRTVLIRDAFVPDEETLADDAGQFVPRIRKGFVLLQSGMGLGVACGAARLMDEDSGGRKLAAHLPLSPNLIFDRAARLSERLANHIDTVQEPDRASFLEVLRTRLEISWLALEAAQVAMLQFGARGYLVGTEASRRLREAQFVAIVTPSVKHITRELATG